MGFRLHHFDPHVLFPVRSPYLCSEQFSKSNTYFLLAAQAKMRTGFLRSDYATQVPTYPQVENIHKCQQPRIQERQTQLRMEHEQTPANDFSTKNSSLWTSKHHQHKQQESIQKLLYNWKVLVGMAICLQSNNQESSTTVGWERDTERDIQPHWDDNLTPDKNGNIANYLGESLTATTTGWEFKKSASTEIATLDKVKGPTVSLNQGAVQCLAQSG